MVIEHKLLQLRPWHSTNLCHPGNLTDRPMQTGIMPLEHYSPTVVPYAGAANLTASPGQVSTLAGFSYGTKAQSPQVQGSPQPTGAEPY